MVAGHVQSRKIDARADDLDLLVGRAPDAACRACEVPAAGVGADDDVGKFTRQAERVIHDLVAERLDAEDAVGGIEGSVEVSRFLEKKQEFVKEFRTYAQLDDLGTVGLAGPCLLDDFRLADAAGIIAFLDDNRLEAVFTAWEATAAP